MKKRIIIYLLIFAIFVLLTSFVIGAENDSVSDAVGIDKGYECLEGLIDDKDQDDLSLQEAIFSTLALGSDRKLDKVIDDNEGNNCWPSGNCKIKETSQVLLAYDRTNKNTDGIEEWLFDRNGTANELTWYLEIDIQNHVASQCTLKYGGSERTIEIGDDMKITGNPGSCLSISSSEYWLRIRDTCLENEFEISCNEDFITTLLYEKNLGGTIYVSSETSSAASLGTTKEKVSSLCFTDGGSCNYEGSLWAALALQKQGFDINSYIPYLLALAENNERYFPSSFLYILTGSDDQYSKTIQSQKQIKFWDIAGSPYNRFYDTSLGLLSLAGSGAAEFDASRAYLLDIQGEEGCWNNKNIRDTGFVLYSGWGKSSVSGSGGGGGSVICGAPNSCEISTECVNAGGTVFHEYDCVNFGEFCCSVSVAKQSCDARNGIICTATQECSGKSVPSTDGSCCLGDACTETRDSNSCEAQAIGNCRSACFNNEIDVSGSCEFAGEVCCAISDIPEPRSNVWIWILVILIIITVLAIVFRKKLFIWWNKIKSKKRGSGKGGPQVFQGNSRPPPRPGYRSMPPRGRRPYNGITPRGPRRKIGGDKELDETLKKLREMSK